MMRAEWTVPGPDATEKPEPAIVQRGETVRIAINGLDRAALCVNTGPDSYLLRIERPKVLPEPVAPRCPRCHVTTRGPLWRLRHRLFICHPWRLEVAARINARALEYYAEETPF